MGKLIVKGKNRLSGEVSIQGAKNAVLPILSACVLVPGEVILHNVPKITDTQVTIDILRHLGVSVKEEKNTLIINATNISQNYVPQDLVKEMRSSIIFMGALLGRTSNVKIGYPGGCKLGERPIDMHLKGLSSLGVTITTNEQYITCYAKKLIANNISLSFPSVGATQNIILAAIYANGITTIKGAAKEPEIIDMIQMLNKCGAKISVSDDIIIEGVTKLSGTEHTIMGDRIVAGTYIAAAAISGGTVALHGIEEKHMLPTIEAFKRCNLIIVSIKNTLVARANHIKAINITTGPHPKFATDMQPQLMAAMCVANGTSIIKESIFEARDMHVQELNSMGANINVINTQDGKIKTKFIVQGDRKLIGTEVYAKDLRGGAALVLAGLCAEGTTVINGAKYINRGYENISNDLQSLGANIAFKGSKEHWPALYNPKSLVALP